MDKIFNTHGQGWDRAFLRISSKLTEPFCQVYHAVRYRLLAPMDSSKFENCASKCNEIAVRIFILLGTLLGTFAFFSMPMATASGIFMLGTASKASRAIGFSLQKSGFTHVQGKPDLVKWDLKNQPFKVMSWNVCGIGGGMSLDHGGVSHWSYRVDQITKKIL